MVDPDSNLNPDNADGDAFVDDDQEALMPESVIDDTGVQLQLVQFFSACHAFLGASVAGVVWRRENGDLMHLSLIHI